MFSQNNKNTLSAVVITFNEEKNIERCIKSLLPVADEIIIVDSYSTDRTKEISLKYNVKFFQMQWKGYAQTKNIANNKATFNWILSLDADEMLSPELQHSILKIKQQHSFFYKIQRLNNYCGKWIKHSGWYPDAKIRLFDKTKAKWEGDFVHEELKVDKKIEAKTLEGYCYHYSFDSIEMHVRQANKYSTLAAQKMFERGKHFSAVKAFSSFFFKFFEILILKKGFLDGFYGLTIAVISSQEKFLRYAKLRELEKERKKTPNNTSPKK